MESRNGQEEENMRTTIKRSHEKGLKKIIVLVGHLIVGGRGEGGEGKEEFGR